MKTLQVNTSKKDNSSRPDLDSVQSAQNVQSVQTVLPFPIRAFPNFYQELINNFRDTLGFQRSYSGITILSIISTCIGNAIKVKVKGSWTESPILYCALYGDSSKKKTPVLNTFLVPFYKKEESYQEEYASSLTEWEQLENKPNKPKRRHKIINDATPESIIDIHSSNPKSLLYLNDELISMVKRFNQYRKGPDQEFWLSQWSNTPVKVTRKTQDTIYFKQPFITVLGGIQPAMLKELVKDSRGDNGFLFRILFAIPEDNAPDMWNDNEVNKELILKYANNIELLDSHFDSMEPIEVGFSETAKESFISWYNENIGYIQHADEDYKKSIFRKLEAYCIRLALVLEVMYQIDSEEELESIGDDAINGAIILTEYFRETSLFIYETIRQQGFKSETDQNIFKELPDHFSTNELLTIACKYGVNKNTAKKRLIPRLTKDGDIIKSVHGKYHKKGVHFVHNVHFDKHDPIAKTLFNMARFKDLNDWQKKAITDEIGEPK